MNFSRIVKLIILLATVAVHAVVLFTITIKTSEKKEREDTTIFKVVDLREYTPLPPRPEKKEEKEETKKEPEEKLEVPRQEEITEEVIETEEEVVTIEDEGPPAETAPRPAPVPEQEEIEYLPQHKISVPPRMPTEEIRNSITYPPLARRQKIEGVVFLELYIDRYGEIRNIKVLKDPGYGLAEAAIKALNGLSAEPAQANGLPVAVRFRYPIRFSIK